MCGRRLLLILLLFFIPHSTPSSSTPSALDALLGRTHGRAFLRRHWQRKHLHAPSAAAQLRGLFSSDELDELFRSGVSVYNESSSVASSSGALPRGRPMQNMLDYSVIKRQRGADGEWWSGKYGAAVDRMPPEQLHDLFRRGFSVVLNRLNYRHPRVAALSAALSEVFGHRVNCNMCVGEETRRETRREKREKRKHLSSYLHVCMCVCVKTETRRDMDLLPVVCLSACARLCCTIENEGRLHSLLHNRNGM